MSNHEPRPRGAKLALLLIVLLAASNLVTAVGAYLVIDRLIHRYTEDLNATAPGMHDVMLLAQEATDVHRAAAALLLARDPAEEVVMLERVEQARASEKKRRNQIMDTPLHGREAENSRAELRDAAIAYEASVTRYLDLLRAGDRQAAKDYRLTTVREAFEAYQRSQREESVRLNMEAMEGGVALSTYADSRKSWLLGIGSWPIVMLGFVFITVALFGLTLWRQLRRMETGEDALGESRRPRF